MSVVMGRTSWAQDLCRALGEDPSLTTKITIVCEINAVVTATIEKYVSKDNPIIEVIQKVAWKKEDENAQ